MVLPAKAYKTELIDRRRLSGKAFEVEFTRPESLGFTPGQVIRFVHDGVEKSYTPISTPEEATLVLCVRDGAPGHFPHVLATVDEGAPFTFKGPFGYFTFRPSERRPVFVATGVGIAPFVSMGRSGVEGFTLIHGVSSASELYYKSFFQTAAKQYVPCLSRAPEPPPGGFSGKVTAYLENRLPSGCYDFYLCGRGDMIREAVNIIDERFPDSFVYIEPFQN